MRFIVLKTGYKMKDKMKINQYIINEVKRIKDNTDYINREELRGFCFTICRFIKQFYEVGTEEYNKNYEYMEKELREIYNKAEKGTKQFIIYVEYKSLKSSVFSFTDTTLQERNKEEVLKRIKEREFFDYNTGRKIKKPIILKQDIKEVLK